MTQATDTEFKARTVTLVREGGQYILKLPRGAGALIPPMCTDWETVTGMTLEEGKQVNIKLHVELCGKVRPRKAPVPPPEVQAEPVRDNRGRHVSHTTVADQWHQLRQVPRHIQRVADMYQEAMRRCHPRHFEIINNHFERELQRALEEARHYMERESRRDERYQELRHRDPGMAFGSIDESGPTY